MRIFWLCFQIFLLPFFFSCNFSYVYVGMFDVVLHISELLHFFNNFFSVSPCIVRIFKANITFPAMPEMCYCFRVHILARYGERFQWISVSFLLLYDLSYPKYQGLNLGVELTQGLDTFCMWAFSEWGKLEDDLSVSGQKVLSLQRICVV